MGKPRFRIKLNRAHEKSGNTAYAVAKALDLNEGTVRKYLTSEVETEVLLSHVILIAKFYDLNWRDPAVVEVIEYDDTDPNVATLSEKAVA